MPNKDPYLERYEQAWQKAKDEQQGKSTRWAGITCPEQYDKTCKLCQLAREIFRNKDNESEEQIERAYDLAQKTKAYINVVLKNDPKKVVILEVGKSILGDLMDLQNGIKGDEYRNFYSLKTGRNIKIMKTGKGRKTEYEVWPRDNVSAFPAGFMKQAHDLENIEKMIAEKAVEPMRAAQLEEGANEMRILPNWRFGEKIELFFYSIKYHTGLTATEFELVQSGQYNPFKSIDVPEDAEVGSGFADDPGTPAEEAAEEDIPDSVTDDKDKTEAEADPFTTDAEDGIEFADDPDTPTDEDNHSPCFGVAADLDTSNEECRECPEFVDCQKKVEDK